MKMRISVVRFPRCRRPRFICSGTRGFTLLELLLVISIIAIASTLIIPTLTSTDSKVFAAQVRQAQAALNYARRIAIVRSAPSEATFRMIDPDAVGNGGASEEQSRQQKTVPRWESDDVAIRFRNSFDQFDEDMEEVGIIFFPQGGSTGGILSFQMDDMRAAIKVDPMTGRISTRFNDEEFDD